MSPQRIEGRPAETSDDVYALGCVLYELLCGFPPYAPDISEKSIRSGQLAAPAAPGALPPIPAALAKLVTAMLARDKARRPVTVQAVRVALDGILQESAPESGPEAVSEIVARARAGDGSPAAAPALQRRVRRSPVAGVRSGRIPAGCGRGSVSCAAARRRRAGEQPSAAAGHRPAGRSAAPGPAAIARAARRGRRSHGRNAAGPQLPGHLAAGAVVGRRLGAGPRGKSRRATISTGGANYPGAQGAYGKAGDHVAGTARASPRNRARGAGSGPAGDRVGRPGRGAGGTGKGRNACWGNPIPRCSRQPAGRRSCRKSWRRWLPPGPRRATAAWRRSGLPGGRC